MEQTSPNSMFELQVDADAGNQFKETSKWSRFVAIIYFVLIGVIAIVFLAAGNAMIDQLNLMFPQMQTFGGILMVIIFGFLAIFFAISFLLYRFASLIKAGIERQDQLIFNRGLQALKNYFLVYGIITLLIIAFNVIEIITSFIAKT